MRVTFALLAALLLADVCAAQYLYRTATPEDICAEQKLREAAKEGRLIHNGMDGHGSEYDRFYQECGGNPEEPVYPEGYQVPPSMEEGL